MADINPNSLEAERETETRIFCMFYNNKTGMFRVTQADAVIVDNIAFEVTFAEAITSMVKAAKEAGVKIHKEKY